MNKVKEKKKHKFSDGETKKSNDKEIQELLNNKIIEKEPGKEHVNEKIKDSIGKTTTKTENVNHCHTYQNYYEKRNCQPLPHLPKLLRKKKMSTTATLTKTTTENRKVYS